MHGEFKTQRGKLVIVDFDIEDDTFANVVVSGDFFLEPPEALDDIISALNGLPAETDEAEIATTVRDALNRDVAMIGFSPEAIATAIRRGVSS